VVFHAAFADGAEQPATQPATTETKPEATALVGPEWPIGGSFPDADRIVLGIAFVPDPRVPRHRRAFDIAIGAISSGMMDTGYMLDRFNFPWPSASTPSKPDNDALDQEGPAQVPDDGKFGVIIYRRDCWRDPGYKCQRSTTQIAALYLVPETVSFGVPRRTFEHALACVRLQLPADTLPRPGPSTRVPTCPIAKAADDKSTTQRDFVARIERNAERSRDRTEALRSALLPGCERMILIGPSFSGSTDSIARALAAMAPDSTNRIAKGVCMLAISATAMSNLLVETYATNPGSSVPAFAATYYSLAVRDDLKFRSLEHLADSIGLEKDPDTKTYPMALLCEDSVFGSGLCDKQGVYSAHATSAAIRMHFPANIADIRYHHRKAESKAESDASPVDVSALSGRLHLDDGAENGSEFPDSLQSPLTAAGSELKLDAMFAILGRQPPRIIAVAATDVRDRLFLFDQLRTQVPGALLVDMEADVLLAHPDFLHSSRGIVMLASHRLHDSRHANSDGDAFRSYATDYEALGIKAIERLMRNENPFAQWTDDPAVMKGPIEAAPCPFVVARGGPRRAFGWNSTEGDLFRDACEATWNDPATIAKMFPAKRPALEEMQGRDYRWYLSGVQQAGGIAGVLLTLIVITWLARRCPAWVTGKWTLPARLLEFATLPVVALFVMLFSIPQGADWTQGLRNLLVICTVLTPLWAIHRAAERVSTTSWPIRSDWFLRWHGLVRRARALPWTVKLVLFVPAVLDIASIMLALSTWILAGPHIGDHWLRLAVDASSGLGLLPALGVTVATTLFGLCCIVFAASRYAHNTAIMRLVTRRVGAALDERELRKSLLLAMYIALVFAIAASLPPTLTIFGKLATYATFGAELALTAQAIMFIAWAALTFRRLHTFAATLNWSVSRRGNPDWQLFWNDWPRGPTLLANTPLAASLQPAVDADRLVQRAEAGRKPEPSSPKSRRLLCPALEQAQQIVGWVEGTPDDNSADRVWAIYRLLVSEVSGLRWSAFGALFSCLAIVIVIYAFPAPGADNFLLLALGLMLLAGLITAYAVMSLERSRWISRVLCNTSERVEFSWSYFSYLLAPVVLLAIAIAIVEEPGVFVWGNGLMSILKYAGLFK
jgi:hypothetical protein